MSLVFVSSMNKDFSSGWNQISIYLSAKLSLDWRGSPNDLSAKTLRDFRGAPKGLIKERYVIDAGPKWPVGLIKKRYVTDVAHQKTFLRCPRAPDVTWVTRGAEWPFRCLDWGYVCSWNGAKMRKHQHFPENLQFFPKIEGGGDQGPLEAFPKILTFW